MNEVTTARAEGDNLGATGIPSRTTDRDLDAAVPVLEGWLATRIPGGTECQVTDLHAPGSNGVANETLLCDATWSSTGIKVERRFVVRVASTDFLYKDVDLTTHIGMCRALATEDGIPVPTVVGYESDPSVLGAPFFVMDRIEGEAPADDPPYHTGGWVAALTTDQRAAMWTDAVEVLARLDQVDPGKLSFLARPGLGASGLEQDVRAWLDYGRWAARGRTLPVPEAGARWLEANLPDDPGTGLAWGDARVGNLLFRDQRVVAVLDWDMVSLAGAESDLAWWAIMEHLYTTSAGVPRLDGIGSPAETVERWQELTGREPRHLPYQCAFAAYRMAVILVRLSDLLGSAGVLPDAMAAEMTSSNSGIQYLATMLDLPYDGPLATPWPGLGKWA